MKKSLLLLLTTLLCWIALPVQAENVPTPLQGISLEEATTRIRKKEDFYLFIGHPDNVDAQLALEQLAKETANKPLYYLSVKGIDGKKYKAFSKKYSIRSHAYLARFANKQQVAVYHNNWKADASELMTFLQQP